MATHEHYDLLIVGSGSTAFAAAIHAQELGKTAVMTEMRTLGETCANRGCLPSKNLIEAARLVYEPPIPAILDLHLESSAWISRCSSPEMMRSSASTAISTMSASWATTDDFIDLVHVYPTMAEALRIVAISFTKDVNRLSCCAS